MRARPDTVLPRALVRALGIAAALCTLMLAPTPAVADVDDFSYSSWHSEYRLSLDDEGRAVAHVTETLVAEFPAYDQNKGVVRGLPQRYEGAGLDVRILSVSDANDDPVPYETDTEDDRLLVLTGTDEYVHGAATYVIEYTMRDVMIATAESGADEFYWDLLPTDSAQDIGAFRADISFSNRLASALTGDTACYQGRHGSTDTCRLDGPRQDGDAQTFTVSSTERAAGDGVTVAIGFEAGTVAQPAARLPDPVADLGPAAAGAAALTAAGAAWAARAAFARRRRRTGRTVVAQLSVPADLPPVVAAALIPRAPDAIPAQLVHLAVHGTLRLEEDPETKRPAVRLLERRDDGSPVNAAMLAALFPGDTTVRTIPRRSTSFAKRMVTLSAQGRKEARGRGWTQRRRSALSVAFGCVAVGLALLAAGALLWSAGRGRDLLPVSTIVVWFSLVGVVIAASVVFSRTEVLTPAGVQRYEHLLGVKEFIRTAEADRLRMLQSYRGAQRRSDGDVDVIHLYERLLPYAMLFRIEESWTDALETRYAESGRRAAWLDHSRAPITSRLAAYSSAMHTAASSSTSSSSGGSGGGGFSGGGGGGGSSGGR